MHVLMFVLHACIIAHHQHLYLFHNTDLVKPHDRRSPVLALVVTFAVMRALRAYGRMYHKLDWSTVKAPIFSVIMLVQRMSLQGRFLTIKTDVGQLREELAMNRGPLNPQAERQPSCLKEYLGNLLAECCTTGFLHVLEQKLRRKLFDAIGCVQGAASSDGLHQLVDLSRCAWAILPQMLGAQKSQSIRSPVIGLVFII